MAHKHQDTESDCKPLGHIWSGEPITWVTSHLHSPPIGRNPLTDRSTLAASTYPTPAESSTTLSSFYDKSKTYCKECNRDFGKLFNYNKHRKDKHEKVRYACKVRGCMKSYTRDQYRRVHEKNHEKGHQSVKA